MTEKQARDYAMFLHLSGLSMLFGIPSFIGPLVMWVIKKEESPFVDRHGKAAVNFHFSVLLYMVIAIVAIAIIAIFTLGIGVILLIPVIILGAIAAMVLLLVLPILACLKAQNGEDYTYPLTIHFLK